MPPKTAASELHDTIQHIPAELVRSVEWITQQDENAFEHGGFAATTAGRTIANKCLPAFADGLERVLDARKAPRGVPQKLIVELRLLDPKELALCIMQATLRSIGQNEDYSKTAKAIGENMRMQRLREGLKSAPNSRKKIEAYVRKKAGPSKLSKKIARVQAAHYGYKTEKWNEDLLLKAGNWGINQLCTLLPNVFSRDDASGGVKHITITPAAVADIGDFMAELVSNNPDWEPLPNPPLPWTAWNKGVTDDPYLQKTLRAVRSWHKTTDDAVRDAINDDTMKPALEALNALQKVTWSINRPVLDVLRDCFTRRIEIEGLPKPGERSENQGDEETRLLARRDNRSNSSDRVQLSYDLQVAERMAGFGRFWVPMNLDWRGRVYALTHFNLQRDEKIRALFRFADGMPIGERGLYWLKVHLANCGDDKLFGSTNKISKQSFGERVAWVDRNWWPIVAVVSDPLQELWWTKAEKPFMFLAACFELVAAVEAGPAFLTQLPVNFDGTCSGLQHLCAMTRDPEGTMVNLTPNEEPKDIYSKVAEGAKKRIYEDTDTEDAQCKQLWLAYDQQHGITRSTVKPNVMTYNYNVTELGMTEQHLQKTINPLDKAAVFQKEPRPFGDHWKQRSAAARYLAKHVKAAIEETMPGPAKAMAYLQSLADEATAAERPLRWTTPAGIPWINRYHVPKYRTIKLWLDDLATYYRTLRVVGEKRKIDKTKTRNGVTANFVHACDAAHLMLTVNAAVSVAEGITSIATVHDSFGCLAPQAERFRQIIREQFVKMYDAHDVLQEVLDRAREDLGEHANKLPTKPAKGTLNIEGVRDAEYAFS